MKVLNPLLKHSAPFFLLKSTTLRVESARGDGRPVSKGRTSSPGQKVRIACTLVELFKVFNLDGNIKIGWFFSGAACFVHDEYYFCLSEQSPQRTARRTALEIREVPAGWLKKR